MATITEPCANPHLTRPKGVPRDVKTLKIKRKEERIMKNRSKLLAICMAMSIVASGCSGSASTSSSSPSASPSVSSGSVASSDAGSGPAEDFSYPMEPITLSVNVDEVDRESIPDWALDYYVWDIIEEKTGVTLERVGASGQGSGNTEDISLMIASGNLPDIFLNNWLAYPGGPEAAIKQNLIIPLNDVYPKYAPNLSQVLADNAKWAKDTSTDAGTYYVFPLLRADRDLNFYGIGYRKDKLDEFGLTVPTTPDELEKVLRTFQQNGVECGLTFEYRFLFTGEQGYGTALQSGFNLKSGLYLDNGVVKFGEYEPAYEDFLNWLHQMYADGLIDPDMPSIDKATSVAKFSNGTAWACICMSSLSVAELFETNPGWEGVGGPSLAVEAGAKPQFGQLQNSYSGLASAAISTDCTNVEAAARFLDWFYAEENLETYQHGVEGFAYAVKDGEYTRDINAPIPIEGENADNVSTRMSYAQIGTNWPMKMLDGMSHDYHKYPDRQGEILSTWRNNNMAEHIMPPVTLTPEESGEYSMLFTDIDTYMREQVAMFIIGTRPMSEFADFRATLEKLGIQRLIEIQQTAYDRYMSR